MPRSTLTVARALALVSVVALWTAGCGGTLLKQYEYEEELYLALDGSATVYVNASVPSLVALRGLDLDISPRARLDRARIRSLFAAPGTRVIRVSSSRRRNRRFVHVRLDVEDIRVLPRSAPFAWSTYRLNESGDLYRYQHVVGAAAGRAVGDVGWSGEELVAFRIHLPSRIRYHDSPAGPLRGNILAWEQPLRDRLAGRPLAMEARIETQSILYRTLWLFGLTAVAVAGAFALLVWWVARKGGEERPGQAVRA